MRSDEILDQIDSTLNDWAVSDDAMRSRPGPEPLGMTGFTPTLEIRDEIGEWQEFRERLARVEAERVRRAQEALEAFMRAYAQAVKPAMAAMAERFAELQKAIQHVNPPPPPGRRRDRPAWQSPYGPPRRR